MALPGIPSPRRGRTFSPPAPVVLFIFFIASTVFPFAAFAGNRIWVPVRWCGVEGAPSMDDPGTVNEATSDDVLWRRHEHRFHA